MKFTVATAALPVLAGVANAGLLDKRGLECNTVYGQGKVAQKLATNTHVKNAGRTVFKTIKTKHTVFVNPTVSRTLTGLTTLTDRVTATKTGLPTTVTITGSSTSTVAAQAGFTAAAAALPSKADTKAAHKYRHVKRDAAPASSTAPAAHVAAAKVAISVDCTRNLAGGIHTVTKTEAARPFVTHYNKAKTVTINHQRTKHVAKVVATTTTHKKSVVEVARATHWAACQSDNLLGWTYGKGGANAGSNSTIGGSNSTSASQVGISSVILVSGTTAKTFDASTAVQCCIRCQTTPGCVGSQWRSGVCNIHVRPAQFGACSAHQQVFTLGTFFANPLSFLGIDEGLILSNGRCGGIWKYGGLTL